jgi:hypothetical protein
LRPRHPSRSPPRLIACVSGAVDRDEHLAISLPAALTGEWSFVMEEQQSVLVVPEQIGRVDVAVAIDVDRFDPEAVGVGRGVDWFCARFLPFFPAAGTAVRDPDSGVVVRQSCDGENWAGSHERLAEQLLNSSL